MAVRLLDPDRQPPRQQMQKHRQRHHHNVGHQHRIGIVPAVGRISESVHDTAGKRHTEHNRQQHKADPQCPVPETLLAASRPAQEQDKHAHSGQISKSQGRPLSHIEIRMEESLDQIVIEPLRIL